MAMLRLDIVTPDKVVLSTDVEYVSAPGAEGEFGVLPGHAPLLSALSVGELYYRADNKTYWAFIAGGFAEVSDDKVTILAESAELASEIDVDRARQAKERAEARIRDYKPDSGIDLVRAQSALTRAINRISVVGR